MKKDAILRFDNGNICERNDKIHEMPWDTETGFFAQKSKKRFNIPFSDNCFHTAHPFGFGMHR
jgi:hypothetical protein